ncbi:hypothetical protein VNO80_15559 [Phaseolus coccineus]|uniref:Uncharacterized protein n=1 Tax=Phaseolus coccineus TaxID=3886 RepID=A0AAN9MLU5_PHACN
MHEGDSGREVRSSGVEKVDRGQLLSNSRIVKSLEGHLETRKPLSSRDAWRDKKGKEKVEWRVVNGKQNGGKMSYAGALKTSTQDRWKGISVEAEQQKLPWMVKSRVGCMKAGISCCETESVVVILVTAACSSKTYLSGALNEAPEMCSPCSGPGWMIGVWERDGAAGDAKSGKVGRWCFKRVAAGLAWKEGWDLNMVFLVVTTSQFWTAT